MPILTPLGTDTLVNTNTAGGQITPRVVQLAGGKYMVIWVGSVVLPVVSTGGTFAAAYANADIRAQIYNADGTASGGEIVINTTTAGAQLRPGVAQLSDGNVLISWHDGVGPAGGSAETTPNTIRAQEFTNAGVASGAEFAIGNSNGRIHSLAATATGGFVVTYQQGGVGGAVAVGNIVAQVYNSNNVQTSSFIVDNTLLVASPTYTVAEADGDVFVYWLDRNATTNVFSWRGGRFDVNGNALGDQTFAPQYTITGAVPLTTGGHMFFGFYNPGSGQPITISAEMRSGDGSLSRTVEVAVVPAIIGTITATPLANGGFILSWGVDSDSGAGVNAEIMAQAFNAIGNPIGAAFQVNSTAALNQSSPSFIQLTDGDIIATWIDESLLNGDTSTAGIVSRRIDFDPVNQNPMASNFTLRLGDNPAAPFDLDPDYYDEFFGSSGYDADGDPLAISAVSNVANGAVTVNPDGTLHVTATLGATAPLAFDYTVADGMGGTATARATIILPNDYATVRPGSTVLIDYLANDFYVPQAGATPFVLPQYIADGTIEQGRASFVSTPQGSRILFNPLAPNRGTIFEWSGVQLNSLYFNILAGNTERVAFFTYSNNQNAGAVLITVQGWAQLGGTSADTLTGTPDNDHLSGGTGAANTLSGGAGDDWYTVRAIGDVIIENVGEGVDNVRTDLTSFTLPDNVENLYFIGVMFSLGGPAVTSGFQGTGNNLSNIIFSGALMPSQLYGLGGNDRLILSTGANGSTIDGGTGTDTFVVNYSVTSLAGIVGIEALELNGGAGLTLTGAQFANGLAKTTAVSGSGAITVNMDAGINFLSQSFAFSGTGVTVTVNGTSGSDIIKCGTGVHIINAGDGADQIRGGTGADTINGGAGNDKIIGFSGADIITGGAGSDQFRYLFASDSGLGANADRITDYAIGSDRLNFSALDTDAVTPGIQGFAFVGNGAFSGGGAASIRYVTSGADLLVQADVNGDGIADMEIILVGDGGGTLTAADFIL
jgi:hypothetical protein